MTGILDTGLNWKHLYYNQWWFQPIWKILISQIGSNWIISQSRGENSKKNWKNHRDKVDESIPYGKQWELIDRTKRRQKNGAPRRKSWSLSWIFQIPIYLEPVAPKPIYQVTIDSTPDEANIQETGTRGQNTKTKKRFQPVGERFLRLMTINLEPLSIIKQLKDEGYHWCIRILDFTLAWLIIIP